MSGGHLHDANGRGGVDLSEARARASDAAPAPVGEEVRLADAVGRVLAASLRTPIPLPHYASSAMDGWAVRGAPPWRLVVGTATGVRLEPGEAFDIVTGGSVPDTADAVLRAEAGRLVGDRLEPVGEAGASDIAGRRHIRAVGTEAVAGEVLLDAGTLMTPPRIALAAATGADRLLVRRRPRVVLVLTGDEVVEEGIPPPGRVRDSFSIAVPAILASLGAEVMAVHRVGDDAEATHAAITADAVDLVVTTGGTGASRTDRVRAAVERLGAEFLVPSIAVRPGGPTFLARVRDRLVLGLPGNPHAAVLGLLAIGPPLLEPWSGGAGRLTKVVAATAIEGRDGVTRLVPAAVGGGAATPAERVGSGMLRGLAAADVVLLVPESGVTAGAPVEAILLPWSR